MVWATGIIMEKRETVKLTAQKAVVIGCKYVASCDAGFPS